MYDVECFLSQVADLHSTVAGGGAGTSDRLFAFEQIVIFTICRSGQRRAMMRSVAALRDGLDAVGKRLDIARRVAGHEKGRDWPSLIS